MFKDFIFMFNMVSIVGQHFAAPAVVRVLECNSVDYDLIFLEVQSFDPEDFGIVHQSI